MPNGIVTYVHHLRAGLSALGLESRIIANRVDDAWTPGQDPEVRDASSFRPPFRIRAIWKARERFAGQDTTGRRLAYAISRALQEFHATEPLDLFEIEESFGAARFVRHAIPRPMIVRLHGPWCLVAPALGLPDDDTFRHRVAAEGRAMRAARALSSPSRYALEGVNRYYGVGFPQSEVVPNPVAVQPDHLRWRFDACDKQTILFVGRFDRLKGGDIVLDAFRRLADEIPNARLVYVGPDRGFRDEVGRTWSFHEYVRAHVSTEVAARIKMLGEQPPATIADLRRQSFVTLVASRFETFSMTAVEALSHGCPLVAPAAGALPEIVEHGKNGLLFAAADAADAARQMVALFRNPGLAQGLAAAGAKDAARRFAPEVVARQMVAFYERACGGSY